MYSIMDRVSRQHLVFAMPYQVHVDIAIVSHSANKGGFIISPYR